MSEYRKVLFISICFLVVFLFSGTNVYSYFQDNFTGTSINSDLWQWYSNSGKISVNDGKISLLGFEDTTDSFPYIYSKVNIFPDLGSFSIYIRIKYLSVGDYGAGITITSDDAPPNGIDPGSNIPKFITFSVWQSDYMGYYYQKYMCNPDNSECNQLIPFDTHPPTYDLDYHEYRIDYSESGQYLIYSDGGDIPLYVSGVNQPRPKKIWIGNSIDTDHASSWSNFEVDYIRVVSDSESEVYPTVLIPGLGASWDMAAILTGIDGGNWQIPSFVKAYEGLITSFHNAGYSETVDPKLFVFAYDWRRPLDTLADRLNEYINEKVPSGKANLVGHSMGGLVARAYAQKYGIQKINKVLTIGSPNMGTVKAYSIWEGAKLLDDIWWAKVALEMTTHFGAITGETEVKTLQRLVPSIKNLLPTYDYLVLNGISLPWLSLKSNNTYLDNLNQNVAQINPITTAIYSSDIQTDSQIKVIKPSQKDILIDLWLDGKPIEIEPFIKANGDGTVTDISERGPFGSTLQGNGWHGELVTREDNIRKIFGVLGLDQTKVIQGENSINERVFVAALRSPGKLEVCNIELTKCNEHLGLYFPNDKLFIFPGYNDEKLRVTVTEDDQHGIYSLHLGNIDDDSAWTVVAGNLINDGQIDIYNIRSIGGNMFAQISPSDKDRCKRDGWRKFTFFNFRNQGDCFGFIDKFKGPFWWI